MLVGARALLVQGASGSGKSLLVLRLIQAGANGALPFVRLVSDDRTHLSAVNGRLLARPPDALAGLIEVRGLGILRLAHEPLAVIGWVADLGMQPERLPNGSAHAHIDGVTLPRIVFPPCADPLPVLLAALGAPTARGEAESGAFGAVQSYR